jgi:uncharacterized protein
VKAHGITLAALAGAALLLATAVAWPDSARSSSADAADDGITVTAVGSARAVPDLAELVFGVTAHGGTAAAASAANAARARKLIDALRSAGIREEDIRTHSVSVSQRHSPDGRPLPGYTAENSVSAKVASARAGATVDLAVENGATNVSGPTFDVVARDAVYREALQDAAREARKKAEAIGAAGGIAVGDVTKVVEGAEAGGSVYLEAAAHDRAKSTPVEPGEEEIQAIVTVTFAAGD